jgi:hypothetical protein
MNPITAKDFLDHHNAGLALCGIDDDRDLEWIGTQKEWDLYKKLSYEELKWEDMSSRERQRAKGLFNPWTINGNG